MVWNGWAYDNSKVQITIYNIIYEKRRFPLSENTFRESHSTFDLAESFNGLRPKGGKKLIVGGIFAVNSCENFAKQVFRVCMSAKHVRSFRNLKSSFVYASISLWKRMRKSMIVF